LNELERLDSELRQNISGEMKCWCFLESNTVFEFGQNNWRTWKVMWFEWMVNEKLLIFGKSQRRKG
jgi:hypothetical protein